jgi:hypothetical protein
MTNDVDIQLSLQWLKNNYTSFDMNTDKFFTSHVPTYLPIYLPTHPRTPAHLPTYLPTHQPTHLPTI